MLAIGAAVLFLHLLIPGFQYQWENLFPEERQSHEDTLKDRDLCKGTLEDFDFDEDKVLSTWYQGHT